MSKPLEVWLSTKLGRIVRLESTETANLLFDGKIFGELMASYGIFVDDLPKAGDFHGALTNLKALNETLSLIGLEQDEDTLLRIAHRDQSHAVKLLFEIYMYLEQFWPYSKGSVLGEHPHKKFRFSEENVVRSGSSHSSVQSVRVQTPSAAVDDIGNEFDSAASLSKLLHTYKNDTIAASRQEINAHRTSYMKK